ncbi:hypothetical protein GJ744_011965 [Endocarpon pusillum]|uniref:DUF1168 domain protein n=1 Tax=Endocarpon pusillum TaxID=364733 RepID=A0A8H7E888_9EURO|nr:hypothetical protein GJ744_011965 [Endocarpon pusillum]
MSEPIPESIPTSLSRPSHRPSKKLRPSPSPSSHNPTTAAALSAQASQISSLMSNPEIPISIPQPTSSTSKTASYTPPEIVANVQGSSAGAGSGEFHVYKASRRREYERIRGMEEEAKREKEDEEWERRERERRERDEREREKNRRRREKKKKSNKNKGQVKGGDGDGDGGDGGQATKDEVDKATGQRGGVAGLQASRRLGNEHDDRLADENGAAENGSGSGVQAGNASLEAIGVVIHDDD